MEWPAHLPLEGGGGVSSEEKEGHRYTHFAGSSTKSSKTSTFRNQSEME